MNWTVLSTLLSYFKHEISNRVDLVNDELIVYFENGKKAKIKVNII